MAGVLVGAREGGGHMQMALPFVVADASLLIGLASAEAYGDL